MLSLAMKMDLNPAHSKSQSNGFQMIEVQAPNEYAVDDEPTIFLAGSIEMGAAERWQDRVIRTLADLDVLILNPRRDDFDPKASQEADDPYFNQQVNWELDGLEAADFILFYFDPKTKSPITLMELGLHVNSYDTTVIVCCPPGFYRRGNVEIVCQRAGITMVDTFDEMIDELRGYLT
jgi:hypothetical protein